MNLKVDRWIGVRNSEDTLEAVPAADRLKNGERQS